MASTKLKENLKTQIIQYLNLLDITPEEIKDDTPLFGEELGLDSIDSIDSIHSIHTLYTLYIDYIDYMHSICTLCTLYLILCTL